MGELVGNPIVSVILIVIGVALAGIFGYRAVKARKDGKNGRK